MTLVPVSSWIYYMDEYKSYLNKTSFPTSMLGWNIHRSRAHTHTHKTKNSKKCNQRKITVAAYNISFYRWQNRNFGKNKKQNTGKKKPEKKTEMKAGRAQTAILQKPHFHNIVIFLIICTPFESAINRDPSISHTYARVCLWRN